MWCGDLGFLVAVNLCIKLVFGIGLLIAALRISMRGRSCRDKSLPQSRGAMGSGGSPELAFQAGLAVLGLQTAGRRPAAGAGLFGATLLTLCHPARRWSAQGIHLCYDTRPASPLPTQALVRLCFFLHNYMILIKNAN